VIASNQAAALGVKNAPFNFPYTVTDADGDTVTVTESVSGAVIRVYTPALGTEQTFDLAGLDFMKVLNGNHTITVMATDSTGRSTSSVWTFSKLVTEATITLAQALTAADPITKAVLNWQGSLPADAELEILLSNNANDPTPTWEDATAVLSQNLNYVFTNATATNGPAFNFRLAVARGASDAGGYIAQVGGAFE
jgi:hypothetical protein